MKIHSAKRPQLAYIFGGMEAIIFQGLIAGFLGGLLVIKSYWIRIKAFFSGKAPEDGSASGADQSGD